MKRSTRTALLTILTILLLASIAYAARVYRSASIAAQNTFCEKIALQGDFNFVLSGNATSTTVTFQGSFDDGTTWIDIKEYTTNTWDVGRAPEGNVKYRAGVKTGDYGSGTAKIRISQ